MHDRMILKQFLMPVSIHDYHKHGDMSPELQLICRMSRPSRRKTGHEAKWQRNRYTKYLPAKKRSLRRLCFHRCLSLVQGVCLPLVSGGVCFWFRGCLPLVLGGCHTPWVDSPPGRHPPGQTLPGQDTPTGRHPQSLPSVCWDIQPPCPVHAGIHPLPLPSVCWDTVNKRAVRIPLECILVT